LHQPDQQPTTIPTEPLVHVSIFTPTSTLGTVNRLELFTPFHPAMSGTKTKLMCLVWPDDEPDEHIVPVKIDDDDTVADLKELIKERHAHMLDKVDACDLVLWKCSGLPDNNLNTTLNTIRFDGSDVRLFRLKALQRISQLFGDEDLSKEPIHILVEVPAFSECGTRFSNSVASYPHPRECMGPCSDFPRYNVPQVHGASSWDFWEGG
jgi:Crinkler effector protein N-terminal domain